MTAEDRKILERLNGSLESLRAAFIQHKAVIDTTLKSYPEFVREVFDTREDVNKIKLLGRVAVVVLTLAIAVVAAVR